MPGCGYLRVLRLTAAPKTCYATPQGSQMERPDCMSPHGASTISVIVPTYREVDNVPILVGRLKAVGVPHALPLELLIVDDASNDGIASLPERLREARWMRVIVRHARRDLCQAVLDGLRAATGDVLVVMDADLSHPPEAIPSLLAALAHPDVDVVLASRSVAGASTHPRWVILPRPNSWIARRLALPFVAVAAPMSRVCAS